MKPKPGLLRLPMILSKQKRTAYLRLIRFDRPIGTLLLLWPTLWALWLAGEGFPRWYLVVIYCLGVFFMRSAGCAINDFADRKVDGRVERTQNRPLPSGEVSAKEALAVAVVLPVISFALVLLTNLLTISLSLVAVILAAIYPFMKRYTHLPQVVLGLAFSWGIPMAFASQTNSLPPQMWALFVTAVLWTVCYDTFYGMVDREDDIKIGVKSTAILFAEQDLVITFALQVMVVIGLLMTGMNFKLGAWYFWGVGVAALLFVYQQYLIRNRDSDACFKAFLNNNWVGLAVFCGVLLDAYAPLLRSNVF